MKFTNFLILASVTFPFNCCLSSKIVENHEHDNHTEHGGSFKRPNYHGMQILLVYHGFGSSKTNSLYDKLFYEQLMSVKTSGLFHIAQEFHVTISCGAEYNEEVLSKSYQVIKNVDENIVNITLKNDSHYEYLGIHKVWELHKTCIDKTKCLILYFHSTGSFNNWDGKNARTANNIVLTRLLVEDWKYIIGLFRHNDDIANVGLSAGCLNQPMQYYNFWWVRASYVAQLPEPTAVSERHYFENWVGMTGSLTKPSQLVSLCETKYDIEPYGTSESCNGRMQTAVRCKEMIEGHMLYGKEMKKKLPRDANNSVIVS